MQNARDSGLECDLFMQTTSLSENGAETQNQTLNKGLLAAIVPRKCYSMLFLCLPVSCQDDQVLES